MRGSISLTGRGSGAGIVALYRCAAEEKRSCDDNHACAVMVVGYGVHMLMCLVVLRYKCSTKIIKSKYENIFFRLDCVF